MLPESAKEKPLSGSVVRTGPGKRKEDGSVEEPKACISIAKHVPLSKRDAFSQVKAGDKILYFKYAGEKMETTTGEQYVVLREPDILCKA